MPLWMMWRRGLTHQHRWSPRFASEGEGVPFDTRVVVSALVEKKRRELMEKSLQKKTTKTRVVLAQRVFGGFFVKGADHPTLRVGVQRENRNASQAFCREGLTVCTCKGSKERKLVTREIW
jgi:hypothetical protein